MGRVNRLPQIDLQFLFSKADETVDLLCLTKSGSSTNLKLMKGDWKGGGKEGWGIQ